jgi:uracil-DNA glycosylase
MKDKNEWKTLILKEKRKTYMKNIYNHIKERQKKVDVYPEEAKRYYALDCSSFKDTTVIILGQDPYHNVGQAMGLSFSVPDGVKIPPSLRNIYKELSSDTGCEVPINGDLTNWAKQGVLLLNAVLSVEKSSPNSHAKMGWETFTDAIIEKINKEKSNVVFILWGAYAQKKSNLIDQERHLVIESSHPSPFSARKGFLGSKCFSRTNEYLKKHGKNKIDWNLN